MGLWDYISDTFFPNANANANSFIPQPNFPPAPNSISDSTTQGNNTGIDAGLQSAHDLRQARLFLE